MNYQFPKNGNVHAKEDIEYDDRTIRKATRGTVVDHWELDGDAIYQIRWDGDTSDRLAYEDDLTN